ncbi:MAG: hypothetical protein Fur0012_08970 [Elusimicrobiota bacterium]
MPEKIKGKKISLAVLGYPLKKTLSPELFRMFFKKKKLKASYTAFRVKPEKLADFIKQNKEFSGFNLTSPLKEKGLELSSRAYREARLASAANMIKRAPDGFTAGNSDAGAFIKSLRGKKFKSACVFGSGGAACAVLLALGRMKTPEVFCISASGKRPKAIGNLIRLFPETRYRFMRSKNIAPFAELYINARISTDRNFNFPAGAEKSFFYDLNYGVNTLFLKKAAQLGARTKDGKEMLFFQAIESFRFFTGQKLSKEEMSEIKKQFIGRF